MNPMAANKAVDVHVEEGVGGHIDNATQAWIFVVDYWGYCGQGDDEASALAALKHKLERSSPELRVVERVYGDERVFSRDRLPATDQEREATARILMPTRSETIALLESATDAELDFDDPDRALPSWATWRTLRQMGWHIADTESRYYLPSLGVPSSPPADDLIEELRQSLGHTLNAIGALPADKYVDTGDEEWTTTKLLRRLAWHERSELVAMRELLARIRDMPSVAQSVVPPRFRGFL